MLLYYIPLILYAIFLAAFLWLQYATIRYEMNFRVVVGLLLGQIITGMIVFWETAAKSIIISPLLSVVLGIFVLAAIILSVIKLSSFDFLIVRSSKFITRQLMEVGLPHKDITLTTKDNVKIAGFHITTGHKKVLILCHGGAHCKNSLDNIMFAQWFSYEYDVISFDFRGHFESEGYWTGDGKTKYDLIAAIDYAKECGYDKIGVWGRSLGGWTAVLVAAECPEVESLVVVSGVLGHIRVTPMVRSLLKLKGWPGRILVRALHGLRYHEYRDEDTKTPVELFPSLRTPTLLIYSQNDETIGNTEQEFIQAHESIPGKKKIFIFEETAHLPNPWNMGPIYEMSKEWFAETL